jgi:hypothetical protein
MYKTLRLKHFRSLSWLLVLCFTISSVLLSNHRFNHEITDFLVDDGVYSFDNNITAGNQDLIKKSQPHHSKHSDCELCFSSIIQGQLLSVNLLALLVLAYGFLVIIVKNYYLTRNNLNSFNLARAPPAFF